MGVLDSIAGKFSSYEHNAKAAADSANKNKPQQEQIVPVTNLDSAKQIGMGKNATNSLGKNMSIFGGAELKNQLASFPAANEYCHNLADREGIKGDAIVALTLNDNNSVACTKYVKSSRFDK